MATLDSLITAPQATDYVRSLYEPLSNQYQLSRLFPTLETRTNNFRWNVDTRVPVAAGFFRGWNTESYIIDRQGVGRKSAEIAPMTIKMYMSEEQELKLRAYDRDDFGPIIDELFNDLATLTEVHVTTYELMRGQVLSDAKVTVKFKVANDADPYEETIDFGLRPEHRITVNTNWSDTAGNDPLTDLLDAMAVYRAYNKRNPGAGYTSQSDFDNLLRSESLRNLFGNNFGAPPILDASDVNRVFTAKGLPPITVIDEQIADQTGAVSDIFPAGKFVFAPAGRIGATWQGVTPAFLGMQEEKIIQKQVGPGLIGQVWKNHDPYERYSLVESIGLPAVGNVNDLMIITTED